MSPCGICDTLSPRERAGVREPVSALAIAATERFMGSPLFETDLPTDLEPGIPGSEPSSVLRPRSSALRPPSSALRPPPSVIARFPVSAG